jgi:hypothetical protein
MAPAGCGRVCARCDKVVHDLSLYELGEAEALLRADPQTCVRARIGADGVVALKPGRQGGARRMAIAAAATAGLLTAGAPALAKREGPGGAIAGKANITGSRGRVVAIGPDRRKFHGTLKSDGRFRIGHLPPGTYRVTVVPYCGERWTIENVVVDRGETIVSDDHDRGECIIVGMLRIEDDRG